MPETAIRELIALARAAQDWVRSYEQTAAPESAPSVEVSNLQQRTKAVSAELERLVRGGRSAGAAELSGGFDAGRLLAVCAACKNIRAETGDWMSLEEFLQAEYDRWITHSICPDCLNDLYPQYGRGWQT